MNVISNENFLSFEFYFLDTGILPCKSWQNQAGFYVQHLNVDLIGPLVDLSDAFVWKPVKVCEGERPNRLRQLMVMIVYLPLMETLWLIQKQLFLLEIVTVRYPRTHDWTGHFFSRGDICGSLIKVDGQSHLRNQWILGEFLSSLDRMLIHCRLIQIVSQVKT